MFLVYFGVTIFILLVVVVNCYPQAVDSRIDAFFSWIERWLDRWEDASESRLRERIEQDEQQLAQYDEALTALTWLRVALVTLPVDDSVR